MMKRYCPSAWLFSCGILSGCSLMSPTVSVQVALPALPPAIRTALEHSGNSRCRIVTESENGLFRETAADYGKTLSVEILKKENALLLVYPPFGLRPCGGFFTGETVFPLTWEGGFLAELLTRIDFPFRNDWNSLLLLARLEGGNPWLKEEAALITAFQTRTLNRYSVKKKALREIAIEEIPEGVWISRFPYESVTVGNDRLFRSALPEGYERFINFQTRQTLSVFVPNAGPPIVMLSGDGW